MFRAFSLWAVGAYGLLSVLWALGGVLLGRYALRLRRAEADMVGLTLGFVAAETLANAAAHFVTLPVAYWLAALLVLALGGIAWFAAGRQPFWTDFPWRAYLALAVLVGVLFPIQRGVALFDEFLHIPLVAIIARDYVPPPFYLDPSLPFAYHYGLHVWAASLVRMAGWFPWVALDLGKAFTIALTTVLTWLWFYRTTHSRGAAWWGSAAVFFGGGARWLLLLLPRSVLLWVSAHISLAGSAADTAATLMEALARPWVLEGGGAMPFPFAFHSGFFVPLHLAMANTAALSWMTVLALLLLGRHLRQAHWTGWAVVALSLANLALSAEHLFAFLVLGLAVAGGFFWWQRKQAPPQVTPWLVVLAVSGLLSVWQGGYITETLRAFLLRWQGQAAVAQANAYGFALRWPPAIPTAHFGALSLFDPAQALVLLTEFGPVLLLIPAAWAMTRRSLRRFRWLTAGLALTAWFNLLFAVFIKYGLDRSMTRMPETAARLWLLLGWPLAWIWFQRIRGRLRLAAQVALGSGMLSGVLLFAILGTARIQLQHTYFVRDMDVLMSQRFWDVLPPHAQVLDNDPSRGVALFGWPVRAFEDVYRPYPDWEALIKSPDPQVVAEAGYDFVYMDEKWRRHIPAAVAEAYQEMPCVKRLGEMGSPLGEWRALYDVRGCRKKP